MGPSVQAVGPHAALEAVVSGTADERVVAYAAAQRVGVRRAVESVVPGGSVERVDPAATVQDVALSVTDDRVTRCRAGDALETECVLVPLARSAVGPARGTEVDRDGPRPVGLVVEDPVGRSVATVDRVVLGTPGDAVVLGPALDRVVARVALDGVVALVAAQSQVVPVAAGDDVVAQATGDAVVARAARERRVVTALALDRVVAGAAGDRVVAVHDGTAVVVADDHDIVAAVGSDVVVARAALEPHIGQTGAVDRVVPGIASEVHRDVEAEDEAADEDRASLVPTDRVLPRPAESLDLRDVAARHVVLAFDRATDVVATVSVRGHAHGDRRRALEPHHGISNGGEEADVRRDRHRLSRLDG